MKVIDILFALICGKVVGFVIGDILKGLGINVGLAATVMLWIIFPLLALVCLWAAEVAGRKVLFVFQAAKFFLVGAFATVVDLKFFELLLWSFSFFAPILPLAAKSISFIAATLVKYWGNKYWAFAKHEKEHMHKEIIQFFAITLGGLAIDLGAFYYATSILGPQLGMPLAVWTKLSVIFAGITAALWNFFGYKFWVFKK